jgi:hypothetical protein
MSLFIESKEVLRLNVVNIGSVLQDWRLILWGEFVNLNLRLFLELTKYVLIRSNRSNYAITIHDRFPA